MTRASMIPGLPRCCRTTTAQCLAVPWDSTSLEGRWCQNRSTWNNVPAGQPGWSAREGPLVAVGVLDLWPFRGPSLRRPGTSLARNDRGQVAQRVVEMVWSERRELNVLAGNRPYRRPVIGECDLGLVWTELGQVVAPDPATEL